MRRPIIPTHRPLRDVPDTTLAMRVGSGDRDAMQELYIRFWKITAKVVCKWGSLREEHDDLLQQTWAVHVPCTLRHWTPAKCPLKSALARAASACLYRRTHSQRNRQLEALLDRRPDRMGAEDGDHRAGALERALRHVPASGSNPEDIVGARELLSVVLRIVLQDPPILPSVPADGWTVLQAATATGVSTMTINRWLAKGVLKRRMVGPRLRIARVDICALLERIQRRAA